MFGTIIFLWMAIQHQAPWWIYALIAGRQIVKILFINRELKHGIFNKENDEVGDLLEKYLKRP